MNPILRRVLKILAWVIGLVAVLIVALVLYIGMAWDRPYDRPPLTRTALRDSATITRGEFLFKYSAACWMCHTPNLKVDEIPSGGKKYDLSELGPGFGTVYVPNITPDVETGIGKWTDGEIVRAIREGIGKDGRAFFIMPSRVFNGLSDEDALAMAAYLKSLPPVRNPVPPQEFSFMTKALFALNIIKPQPPITEPVTAPPRGVTIEWGSYLANHVSTCTDCHSPVDLNTGQFYLDSLFIGSNMLIGEPFGKEEEEKIEPIWAYGRNLSPDPETGIGKWSEEEFVMAMKTGMRPDGTVLLASAMPYPYFTLWEEDDLKAIYKYLQTLHPVRRATPPPVFYSKDIQEGSGPARGKAFFRAYCQPCHGEQGKGAAATKVKLAEVGPSIDNKVMKEFINKGQLNLKMPAFGKTLTSDQLDDVIAFIRSWEKK